MHLDEHKDWKARMEAAKKRNEELLLRFEKWLKEKSLSKKTIDTHVGNIRFFSEVYLLHTSEPEIEDGWQDIEGFLGFFIEKATWASKYTLQENIASFQKFYNFLYEIGEISASDLQEMQEMIKSRKKLWLNAKR